MDIIIFMIGILAVIGGFLLLVVNLIKKQPIKKFGITMLVGVVLIGVGLFMPTGNEDKPKEVANENEVTEEEEVEEEPIEEVKEIEEENETFNLIGEIHKLENKDWTDEFKLLDKEENEYIIISNDDVPSNFMEDGLIYKVIGDKEDDKLNLIETETLADNWEAYENIVAKEKEIAEIENTIKTRVEEEYRKTTINDIKINEHSGEEASEDDYIVLVHLKWDVKNKPEMTRDFLEKYSGDLATTLAKHKNIKDITVFWEVPYYLEDENIAKISATRSGDGMAKGEIWYAPLIR